MLKPVSGSRRDDQFKESHGGTVHTVLVVGGYGFFGGRICAALAKNPAIRLLIGGRSADRGRQLAAELGLPGDQAVVVDVADAGDGRRGLREVLVEEGVATLIHTAGPFQGQDYAVARTAIEAGCHYIDLAVHLCGTSEPAQPVDGTDRQR
ncbi:MAG TPA: saccharopine dehydrogenase NADP-binding domain-containing protein [Steroidobacteraceae bacterium]